MKSYSTQFLVIFFLKRRRADPQNVNDFWLFCAVYSRFNWFSELSPRSAGLTIYKTFITSFKCLNIQVVHNYDFTKPHFAFKMDHEIRKRNQEGDFKVGLCGCFSSCSNCCAVCCCQPCMWGRIAGKFNFLGIKGLHWIIISILVFSYAVLNQLSISAVASSIALGVNSALVNNEKIETEIPTYYKIFGVFSMGISLVFIVLTCALRTKVRESNNISGSALCDFFASLCCGMCSICQMSTEAGLDEERAFDICNYPEPDIV